MGENTKRPARVAYFSDAPWVGGAERYLHLLASGLPRDEFEPCLIVDDAARLETLVSWMRGSGVPVHEVSLPAGFGPVDAGRFAQAIRALDVAIFHCNMPGPWGSRYGLAAPLARLGGARAVVSTEHLAMVPSFAKGALLKRAGGVFIDRVITVSEDNVRWLRELHRVPAGKIRVVRLGVPEPPAVDGGAARRELGLGGDDFACLIVASIEERKGHRFALEAIARLPRAVKLLVAGKGEGEEACRRRAAELGVSERVRFLGFRHDVPALIASCDALLVPSLVEATPYVILEAMALSRPVIASRIYGIPELVTEGSTGTLVEPGDVEALVRAILALERDRALVERMGAGARARYESAFRLERCVAETAAVYRELLQK